MWQKALRQQIVSQQTLQQKPLQLKAMQQKTLPPEKRTVPQKVKGGRDCVGPRGANAQTAKLRPHHQHRGLPLAERTDLQKVKHPKGPQSRCRHRGRAQPVLSPTHFISKKGEPQSHLSEGR
mmetsp:Transcript_79866/g.133418  ORF Transcript_79866/g.133418 Transcript_79866/m.133418 type:complete len:122 (+) Transcript_79866:370-735(+)